MAYFNRDRIEGGEGTGRGAGANEASKCIVYDSESKYFLFLSLSISSYSYSTLLFYSEPPSSLRLRPAATAFHREFSVSSSSTRRWSSPNAARSF